MKKKIAFRVDISSKIGSGHFQRLKILEQLLIKKNIYWFVSGEKKLINFFFKNKIKNIFRIRNENDVYKNLIKEKINSIIMDLSYFKNIKSGKILKIQKFYKDKNIYLISFDDPRHKILSDISIIPYDYDLDKLKIINKNNKLFLGREYFLFSNQVKKLSLKKRK